MIDAHPQAIGAPCFLTGAAKLVEGATPPCTEREISSAALSGRLLHYGVDSLEYCAYCDFGDDWEKITASLEEGKESARGLEEGVPFTVNGELSGNILPRGFGLFRYVIVTQFGQIRFAQQAVADSYPNVWVKCSSEGLHALSLEAIEAYFQSWIESLGGKVMAIKDKRTGQPVHNYRVNRLDLAADFRMSSPLTVDWLETRKVCRQTRWTSHLDGDRLQTYYVGDMKKSHVLMRIYDKLEQIRAENRAAHILDVWPDEDGAIRREAFTPTDGAHVWRVEFEVKKEVLREYEVVTLRDIAEKQQAIWRHLTVDWCAFREDTEASRTNVSRRPVSPFWLTVQESSGTLEKAVRKPPVCKPINREEIVKRAAGNLLLFAASEEGASYDPADFWEVWNLLGRWVRRSLGGEADFRRKIAESRRAREMQIAEWQRFQAARMQAPTEADCERSRETLAAVQAAKVEDGNAFDPYD